MLCCAHLRSLRRVPWSCSSSVLMICMNIGSFAKRSHKVACSSGTSTMNRSCLTSVSSSLSGLTSHSLLSLHPFGVPSYCQLTPSAMLLIPGMCRMSTIWCASMPSRHRAWVAFRVSLRSTSWSAWQSVSSSTGNPHIVSPNLSSENFSAANSSR